MRLLELLQRPDAFAAGLPVAALLILQRLLHLLNRLLKLVAGLIEFGGTAFPRQALQLSLQLFRFIQQLLLGLRRICRRRGLAGLAPLLLAALTLLLALLLTLSGTAPRWAA